MTQPALGEPADAELASVACGRCAQCGYLFAPWQALGCERCGSHGSDIEPRQLPAAGRLLSWATVYVSRAAVPPAPFTVIELELDNGPTIRALLETVPGKALYSGARVVAFARETDGAVAGSLRFTVAEQAERGK